ncbi:hypothetical protein N9165_01435 [Akkermansiaceae bacterium]|nr:hypothetical protein [Akkermansiaceae bacterium]
MKKIAYTLTLGIASLFLSSCCGLVGTAQGASGEPHIGQIPIMRILAE